MSYNKKETPKGWSNIKGKLYKNVVLRVNEFRTSDNFAGFGIDTSIKDFGFQTGFVIVEAKIIDPKGRIVGSGLAEEKRGSSNINNFSALENCETSAIGRALASIGLGGEEYCSADELLLSLDKQEKEKAQGGIANKVLKSLGVNPKIKSKNSTPPNVSIVPDPKEEFKHVLATASRFASQKRCLSICKVSLNQDADGKFTEGLNQLGQLDDMQLRRCTTDLLVIEKEYNAYLKEERQKGVSK